MTKKPDIFLCCSKISKIYPSTSYRSRTWINFLYFVVQCWLSTQIYIMHCITISTNLYRSFIYIEDRDTFFNFHIFPFFIAVNLFVVYKFYLKGRLSSLFFYPCFYHMTPNLTWWYSTNQVIFLSCVPPLPKIYDPPVI